MFLAKNLLIGLGSVGVVGAGGYGIYSATRSSSEDAIENKGENSKPTSLSGSESESEVTQSTESDNSTRANVGTGDTAGSPLTTAGGRGENPGSGE